MNKYQLRLLPGTDEARRAYCECPAHASDGSLYAPDAECRPAHFGDTLMLVRPSCPLHGSDPRHQLPEGI